MLPSNASGVKLPGNEVFLKAADSKKSSFVDALLCFVVNSDDIIDWYVLLKAST